MSPEEKFQQIFYSRPVDERRLGNIEFVLNSPAYESDFKVYIQDIVAQLERLTRDRSQKRKDEYPDDFLFGGIAFGEGLLAFFEHLIRETSMERIHASMENMSNEMLYDRAGAAGKIKPVVGLDQQAQPSRRDYSAEDDF